MRLDEKRCRGCVNCTKRCPTEAIRVHNGKAQIIESRCIDCGECIRHCLHRAKAAHTDDLEILDAYKYTIALPAPAMYAQFNPDVCNEKINAAIRGIGFNEVYEVAKAAEIVTVAIREYMQKASIPLPVISSACPVVVRLIQVRFPELQEYLLPFDAPIEVAATIAREEAVRTTGLASEDIGIFFITPCPAKMTAIKQPSANRTSNIDGAIALNKIYFSVLKNLVKVTEPVEDGPSDIGVGWALSGGETVGIPPERCLVVSEIQNVIQVFEAMCLGKLRNIDYVECLSCGGGCIGGPLTVENRFTAELNMKKRLKKLKKCSTSSLIRAEKMYAQGVVRKLDIRVAKAGSPLQLDEDVERALVKVELLEKTLDSLPGFDCGSCGSPNCKSLAEDIVRGNAVPTDCIFKLREKVQNLAEEIVDLANKLPPVMSRDHFEDEGEEK